MHQTQEDIRQEQALVEAAQKNPAQFRPLYEKYYRPIFLFIYKRVDTEEEAAEISGQVFMKALEHLPRYEYRGVPFSAWLFRIAMNQVNIHYREVGKTRVVSLEQDRLPPLVEEEATTWENDDMEILTKLLDHLEEEELTLIELRYFEKLSVKEVSTILKMTESNVKVKTHRIIGKLRKIALSLRKS
ncbi:sigma-70 family RNA polymerase sigma factor [Algivirga pacifica]|uniref:RNA polymerase sigma factor n=1 Tax=Algivirga pacifica TaxID=1162670 RepID=A0ABP9CZ64_9BACT